MEIKRKHIAVAVINAMAVMAVSGAAYAQYSEPQKVERVEITGSAIKRIDDGEYGYCEETGDPIGVARLLARPTATLSLEAQQRRELKQKLYGD